ncbi:MAG: hypothetical protein ACJZ8I_03965 [Paracoccaceae bacterium]
MAMIFSISSEDNFGEPVKVETTDLDFSSGFQIDEAQLTGLDLSGSRFNFKARTINPINGSLSIISGNDILGTITFSPEMLLKIKAEKASFDTTSNLMKLEGNLHLENDKFSVFGSTVTFDFDKNIIHSNKDIIVLMPSTEIKAGRIKVFRNSSENSHFKIFLGNRVILKYLL